MKKATFALCAALAAAGPVGSASAGDALIDQIRSHPGFSQWRSKIETQAPNLAKWLDSKGLGMDSKIVQNKPINRLSGRQTENDNDVEIVQKGVSNSLDWSQRGRSNSIVVRQHSTGSNAATIRQTGR